MRNYLVMTLDQDRRSRTGGRITPHFLRAGTARTAMNRAKELAADLGQILIDTIPVNRVSGSRFLLNPSASI